MIYFKVATLKIPTLKLFSKILNLTSCCINSGKTRRFSENLQISCFSTFLKNKTLAQRISSQRRSNIVFISKETQNDEFFQAVLHWYTCFDPLSSGSSRSTNFVSKETKYGVQSQFSRIKYILCV